MLIILTEALESAGRRWPANRSSPSPAHRRDQTRLRKEVWDVIFGGWARAERRGREDDDQIADHDAGPAARRRGLRDERLPAARSTSRATRPRSWRSIGRCSRRTTPCGRRSELDVASPAKRCRPCASRSRRSSAPVRRSASTCAAGAVVVVDLEQGALAGKDDGSGSARERRARPRQPAAARARRLERRSRCSPPPAAATDSLLLLRVEAIAQDTARGRAGEASTPCAAEPRAIAALARARRRTPAHRRRVTDGARWEVPVTDFVFATAQYESGDWDSAPLVPANIIDTIARYTTINVAPTGMIVPLSMTGPCATRSCSHRASPGAVHRRRGATVRAIRRARRLAVRGRPQPRHRRRVPQDRHRGD